MPRRLRCRPMAKTCASTCRRMAVGAAFFDLDRTLLAGRQRPVISAALQAVGLMSDRSIPGAGLLFRVFDLFGENRPSMMLTRQAARLARAGQSTAQEAGKLAADELVDLVQPYAQVLIDEHRAAGRTVVWPPPRPTTSSSRWPSCWASTT